MGKFSKIFHHIETKDLRNKHEQKKVAKIQEEKKEEEFKQYLVSTMEKKRYSWREGMTTSDVSTISVEKVPGDGDVAVIDAIDNTSYANVKMPVDIGTDGVVDGAFVGTEIRNSGSGSGSNGGFDVGGQYLAFQGTGDAFNNARFASLGAIDSSQVDTLTITAIVGNDVNGGEDPDLGAESLFVLYKTPAMERAQILAMDPGGGAPAEYNYQDIIIHTPLDGQSGRRTNNGGLNDYSIAIPDYARAEGTQFVLYQNFNSGVGYDHYGITKINFQRKAPMSVVVPLDNPEASSFIRGAEQGSTPKKRKKDVNDKLEASDEYTQAKFGNEFPGQEVRVGGEDPFKGAEIGDDVEPSPQGKDEVKKSFANFQKGDERVEVIKTPEQIKAQNDEYLVDLENLLTRNEYDYTDPKIIEIADEILKTDPKNIDAYFYKLGTQYETGDMKAVLKTTDAMIKNNPDDPTGYEMRSFVKGEEGDLAGAIEDLEKAIELDPDSEFVAYNEMELADLKFQEAEVETDNAKRDRMESEAGAIEAKAHEDYWDNADLIEQEQEELAEYQYVSDEQLLRDFIGFDNFYGVPQNPGRSDEVPSMLRAAQTYASQLEHTDDYDDEYQEIINAAQSWEGTETEWAKFYADAYMRIVYDGDYDQRTYNWIYDGALRNAKYGSGGINAFGTPAGILGGYKLSKVDEMSPQKVVSEFKRLLEWWYHSSIGQASVNIIARSKDAKLNNLAPYLNALAKNLPDYYFETDSEEPINTLYDQMKALYDEEDPDKEIKTELNELGFDKQYKDLMSAWDSADKFSKFITPLKNLSDALLGSKTAQNAKYENYKIAIAKSIMLNKPIRVNPDTIDPSLKTKLVSKLESSMFLDYDLEQFYKENPGPDGYMYPQGDGSGFGLIPIVSEAIPYADENIYEDEFGRVFTNDGSTENTTFQPFKEFYSWQTGLVETIKGGNPLAGRGQAQYQIVVPPDGTEPYLLYKDHAYHNVKSADEGEVPFMNQGAAGFVNWLGNTAHARGDGDENTGGMAGYPPNIRGDVITKFRVNLTDLPEAVRDTIYRHPLLTENPGFVQALKDTAYNKEFEAINKEVNSLAGSKKAHELYTKILEKADIVKDLVVDNVVETIMGELPGKWNMTSASNMLQKYDEFIQGTVFTPDGRAYVPGIIEADGTVLRRIDVTDQFEKTQQNNLKNLMSDKSMEVMLKNYLDGKSTKSAFENTLTDHLRQTSRVGSGHYDPVLANSLGKGSTIDVDAFLNGKIKIKKGFEFRPIPTPKFDIKRGYKSYKEVAPHWLINAMAERIDVSNDASAAGNPLLSLATMTAARQLLRPVRGPANTIGGKQTFAQAMESAPQMPYKIEFDFPEKMLQILQGIEDEDKPKDDTSKDRVIDGRFVPAGFPDPKTNPDAYYQSNLGSAGDIGGVDATAAATLAGEKKKKKKKGKVNESKLFERLKKRPFFNQDDIKPEFPENPPPKLDPKTGMHPQYGKKAKRYGKLDPISANSMPPTGDPEIDAVVNKQKTINKIKKMARNK